MEEEQRHLEILQQQLLHEQAMLLVSVYSVDILLFTFTAVALFSLLLLIPLCLSSDVSNDPWLDVGLIYLT